MVSPQTHAKVNWIWRQQPNVYNHIYITYLCYSSSATITYITITYISPLYKIPTSDHTQPRDGCMSWRDDMMSTIVLRQSLCEDVLGRWLCLFMLMLRHDVTPWTLTQHISATRLVNISLTIWIHKLYRCRMSSRHSVTMVSLDVAQFILFSLYIIFYMNGFFSWHSNLGGKANNFSSKHVLLPWCQDVKS